MLLQPNQRFAFIGDSITDCGRTKPIAEGLFDPLGRGYVTFVSSLLGTMYPHLNLRITNVGTSGNRVRDLKERWQTDVIDLKPDWLSIMIGTNDVWRQFDSPAMPEIHVLPDEYEKTLEELVIKTKPLVKGLLLCTPFMVEPNLADPMRNRMDQYSDIVRAISKKYTTHLADTQSGFDKVLLNYHPMTLAWDRIHPNQTGHMIIAKSVLNAIGFEWR